MDKTRIAILEFETHTQVIKQWDFLLKDSAVIDVEYYLHSKLKVNLAFLDPKKAFYTDAQTDEELQSFISEIKQYDLVIVNTLHRHFKAYKELFGKQKTLCIVHNPNFSLFRNPISIGNLIRERAQFVYLMKLFIKERIRKYQDMIFKSDFFGVFSKSIYEEILSKKVVPAENLQIISLVYSEYANFHPAKPIKIVIPGTVSEKRKDYQIVFDTIEKLQPKVPMAFYFLGRPENSKMRQKLEALSRLGTQNLEVIFYEKLIPSKEFDEVIQASHLLLCPVKSKTSFYGVTEFYGKTKISGNEYDCVRNGKIGLFPNSYPKMSWHNLYYEDSSDLESMLNNLTLEQLSSEYEKLQPYLKQYTFESVKTNLENQLLALANAK